MKHETSTTLQCTPQALQYIREKLATQVPGSILRIRMKKAGCSGWLYEFDYGLAPQSDETAYQTSDGLTVLLQRKYHAFFEGAILEYVQSGFERKLTCINPREVARCGCGESFTVVQQPDKATQD